MYIDHKRWCHDLWHEVSDPLAATKPHLTVQRWQEPPASVAIAMSNHWPLTCQAVLQSWCWRIPRGIPLWLLLPPGDAQTGIEMQKICLATRCAFFCWANCHILATWKLQKISELSMFSSLIHALENATVCVQEKWEGPALPSSCYQEVVQPHLAIDIKQFKTSKTLQRTDSSGLISWHEALCASSWWTMMKWWNANLVVLFGCQRCAALLHLAGMSLFSLLLQVSVASHWLFLHLSRSLWNLLGTRKV